MTEASPVPEGTTGGRTAGRRPGPVPAHSRDDIAAAAVMLADREGLAGLSMRAVGAALHTGAGSLYRYVASREELVALMTDRVMGELRPYPSVSGSWLDLMVALSRRQWDLFRRHPWLIDTLQQGAAALGPESLAWLDHSIAVLATVRASDRSKLEAIGLATGVTTLFARSVTHPPLTLPVIDEQLHPHLAKAMAHPLDPSDQRDLFDATLRSLLRGLLS